LNDGVALAPSAASEWLLSLALVPDAAVRMLATTKHLRVIQSAKESGQRRKRG
jgi:hypothetical protein